MLIPAFSNRPLLHSTCCRKTFASGPETAWISASDPARPLKLRPWHGLGTAPHDINRTESRGCRQAEQSLKCGRDVHERVFESLHPPPPLTVEPVVLSRAEHFARQTRALSQGLSLSRPLLRQIRRKTMINGRSLYNFSLGRRTGDSQEKFGVGSLLAFCSAKVLRGGPRTLVQLTTCVVALVLVLKLWHHGVTDYDYNGWSWTNPWDGDEVQTPVEEDDGSVPGGLRIVVFGENDIATPPRGVQDPNNRSWTEVLCEEVRRASERLPLLHGVKADLDFSSTALPTSPSSLQPTTRATSWPRRDCTRVQSSERSI